MEGIDQQDETDMSTTELPVIAPFTELSDSSDDEQTEVKQDILVIPFQEELANDARFTTTPSDAAGTPGTGRAEDPKDRNAFKHVLILFSRLYGVYYVPPHVRAQLRVGDLALCESHHGQNVGTIVADVSQDIEKVLAKSQSDEKKTDSSKAQSEDDRSKTHEALLQKVEPPCTTEDKIIHCSINLHQGEKSGINMDRLFLRLPLVIRRAVNKDKKKLYFARKRDIEALQTARTAVGKMREMLSNPQWGRNVMEVEYQVDFHMTTLFCDGSPIPPQDPDINSMAMSLTGPLRTEYVEIRFPMSDPRELHLTRYILTDPDLLETLSKYVTEHLSKTGRVGGSPSAPVFDVEGSRSSLSFSPAFPSAPSSLMGPVLPQQGGTPYPAPHGMSYLGPPPPGMAPYPYSYGPGNSVPVMMNVPPQGFAVSARPGEPPLFLPPGTPLGPRYVLGPPSGDNSHMGYPQNPFHSIPVSQGTSSGSENPSSGVFFYPPPLPPHYVPAPFPGQGPPPGGYPMPAPMWGGPHQGFYIMQTPPTLYGGPPPMNTSQNHPNGNVVLMMPAPSHEDPQRKI
ncbi:hypothetical protein, conserved [Angomonas deanei]|uniref:PSP1 C-terminal conserved region containing protein n=1 Tax=Angomonas deanei TaxID=59799 RepID=A0A7G2C353_9TRYP|nr:hypothetical protein, conserved [Angomonas deanei]